MELARWHIFREFDVLEEWLGLGRPALRRTLPWIGATLVLGLLFLAGQIIAWKQLTAQGFAFDRWATPASYFFYLITGLARRPPGPRRPGSAVLPVRSRPAQARRIAPDRSRRDGMVLARHDFAWMVLFAVLDSGTMRNLSSLSRARSESLLRISFTP